MVYLGLKTGDLEYLASSNSYNASFNGSNEMMGWLVQYYLDYNIPRSLGKMRGGVVYSDKGRPLREGEENPWVTGCLILENGETLAERLKEERVILDRSSPRFETVLDYASLVQFLEKYSQMDGAYIRDSKGGRMARVARFSNSSRHIDHARESATERLPPNFVRHDGTELNSEDYDYSIGTKTDLAVNLPAAYSTPESHVRAYQIKRTVYGDTGLGKIVMFDAQGLKEEYFFRRSVDNPSLLECMHRKYEVREGQLEQVAEEVVAEVQVPERRRNPRNRLPRNTGRHLGRYNLVTAAAIDGC